MSSKLANRGERPLVLESGVQAVHRPNGITRFTITDKPVTVGNTTGVSFGGSKLWTYPAGLIRVASVHVVSLSIGLGNAGNATPIDGDDNGDFSLGTTAPSDGTLSTTDVDHLASTALAFDTPLANVRETVDSDFDGTSTPVPVFANFLVDDADVGDGASDIIEVSAVIDVVFWDLGGAGA